MDIKAVLEHHILDHVFKRIPFDGLSLPWSLHLVMMLIAAGLLILMGVAFRTRRREPVPTGFHGLIESFVVYIRDEILKPCLGDHYASLYLDYFLTLFFFILLCNLGGLVPFGATATGNIAVTGGLALCTFGFIHVAGIQEHGVLGYIKSYIPHGIHPVLAVLMLFIEGLGLLTRTIALAIRLFANMVAGHIVILSLVSLIFLLRNVAFLVAPGSVGIAVAISLLEIFIAFLQAYVFTFLTAVFVGMSLHPAH
jgi:F-type H+-transporting ATPase subunit a